MNNIETLIKNNTRQLIAQHLTIIDTNPPECVGKLIKENLNEAYKNLPADTEFDTLRLLIRIVEHRINRK